MTREIAFLLACVRRFFVQPGSPAPDPSGLDWNALLDLAGQHVITPLLYQSVHVACADGVPPPVLDQLRERCRDGAHFNLILILELARLLTLLDRAGIAAVPLKGPALSALLYGSQSLRSSSDLDLLVRPGDALRAMDLFLANGYQLRSMLHWPARSACLRSRECQISFSGPVSVDLHWRILPDYFPHPIDGESTWQNLRPVPVAGATAMTLSPEHLLLFLCAHGAKHCWERLGWFCDVARLVQVEPDMDWPYCFSQAERTGTSRLLCLGLAVAEDLTGVELPPQAAVHAAADPVARALARTVRRRLLAGAPIPAPPLESAAFSWRMFERNSHRLRYLAGTFVWPSEAEYRALRLPPALYFLYYPFRQLRLIAKYAARAMNSVRS